MLLFSSLISNDNSLFINIYTHDGTLRISKVVQTRTVGKVECLFFIVQENGKDHETIFPRKNNNHCVGFVVIV